MAASKAVATAINIVTAPAEAFATLRERPTVLVPLAAILAATAGVVLWYYSGVDVPWLMDLTLPAEGPNMTEEQRAQLIETMSEVSPMVLGFFAAVSSVVFLTVWFLLYAAYFRVISAIRHDDFRFKQWFSLVCWCSIVLIVSQLATMANMYFNGAEFMRPDRLNPLSFASLLELDGLGDSIANRVITTMDVTAIWGAILIVLGYRHWTAATWATALGVALAPIAVIGAGLYLFAR